ncbi:MAG TPA: hypothetical protein VFN32_09455 [Rhodococcus sp. (in: high G+C Gram-positive bacteria)]|uniref:hypothetical protein n=1 Tax=Rhodococcus sp. SJ-3 TaxID=3454628 RepID=UPI002D9A5FAC|nr:hypothetical protein [Rhodococcus sp. (in: high G+C Gram-positive bacteria)]
MTDSKGTDTGQISVAELLARNGKKVGTRSSGGGRRRRGTTGGISVAELTGEIPITRPATEAQPTATPESGRGPAGDDRSPQAPAVATPRTPKVEPVVPETPQVEPVVPATPKVVAPELSTPAPPSANELTTITSTVADVDATTVTPAVVEPVAAEPVVRTRAVRKPAVGKTEFGQTAAPDRPATIADGAKVESPTEVIRPEALPRRARAHLDNVTGSVPVVQQASPSPRASETPEPRLLSGPASDLQGTGADNEGDETATIGVAKDEGGGKSPSKSKFPSKNKAAPSKSSGKAASGSGTAAKDGARASGTSSKGTSGKSASGKAKPDTDSDDVVDGSGSSAKQWMLLVGESIAAIVVGGLLFKGFEKLWDMMPWVAFGLALLVIVGLVALVRVLRRTDDITSQLIAVGVGAFVAFGPLLFLLPNG